MGRSDRRTAGGWLGATLAAVAVALLLPLAIFVVSAWLLGWQLQSVLSGSMAPGLPVGSLVVVGQVDASAVEVGSVIVFMDPAHRDRLVTHRVVALAPGDALAFITKGDANATNDVAPVSADLLRGHPLWHVTYLGTALEWLQWPRSFLLLVLGPALVLGALSLRDRRARRASLAPAISGA